MKRFHGVTLINLLIAMSIAAILVGIAVPNMGSIVKRAETNQTAKTLFRLINFARLQAVSYQEYTVLCPTLDFISCDDDWTSELMVFIDINNNQAFDDAEDSLLTKGLLQDGAPSIVWRSFASRPFIRFDEHGTTIYQNGRIYICDPSQRYKAQIVIYRSGRARFARSDQLIDSCG